MKRIFSIKPEAKWKCIVKNISVSVPRFLLLNSQSTSRMNYLIVDSFESAKRNDNIHVSCEQKNKGIVKIESWTIFSIVRLINTSSWFKKGKKGSPSARSVHTLLQKLLQTLLCCYRCTTGISLRHSSLIYSTAGNNCLFISIFSFAHWFTDQFQWKSLSYKSWYFMVHIVANFISV